MRPIKEASLLRLWLTRRGSGMKGDVPYVRYESAGRRKALSLFHAAAKRVPAYKDFLRKHAVKPDSIRTYADFLNVPVTTKENYIEVYDVWARAWDGKPAGTTMISTSSGTTGAPHYWPRSMRHDLDGAIVHEFFLSSIFGIEKLPTLFVNGFAMGNWIAGTFTYISTTLVSWKGYPMTVMTPGYDRDAVIRVLTEVAPHFGQVILTGHTPFLKEIVDVLYEKGPQTRLPCKLLGTGQGVTEGWRDYIVARVGSTDPYRTFINLYGSADASLMGFETPVSIAVRRTVSLTGDETVFGGSRLPSLYQYDPRRTFFEVESGELCITKDSGVPLIRYNIHDTGGIRSYPRMIECLQGDEIVRQTQAYPWQLPFVYLFGREKFMVKVYGANIYTEHVARALDHEQLIGLITGRFVLTMSEDQKKNPILLVRVELRENAPRNPAFARLIRDIFIAEVGRINSEYRFVLSSMGSKAHPTIVLHTFGDPEYFPKGVVKKTA